MRIVRSDFMSLDGVVQAPGGKKEDTDGGFEHGGWSMRFFDADAMGPAIDEAMQSTEACPKPPAGGPRRPAPRDCPS